MNGSIDALTESKKRERLLQDQVNELQDFIENAALPLHWVNGSGIITWANRLELDMLGYGKEEYIGRPASDFHAEKDIIGDILKRLAKKEIVLNCQARLVTKSGDIKHVLINANGIWRDDKFIHATFFTRDITDIKRMEQKRADIITALEEKINVLKAEILFVKKNRVR